jgi:hypothetical protein
MELGIMELTAIEGRAFTESPPMPDQTPGAAVGYYSVYFRSEYFGRIPERLLGDVREAMAAAGGFDFQPEQRTLTALHQPRLYAAMCREIVYLVHEWMTGELFLSK